MRDFFFIGKPMAFIIVYLTKMYFHASHLQHFLQLVNTLLKIKHQILGNMKR